MHPIAYKKIFNKRKMTFIGQYTSKIDDKGRVVFPAPFKNELHVSSDRRFVIKKSLYDNCLEMWPYDEWERESDSIRRSLDFFNPNHIRFWRQYMRGCDIVEPDIKFGRISVSKKLLSAIGVNKEVVFFGINYKLEIWAAEEFESSQVPTDEYVALAKSLSREQ